MALTPEEQQQKRAEALKASAETDAHASNSSGTDRSKPIPPVQSDTKPGDADKGGSWLHRKLRGADPTTIAAAGRGKFAEATDALKSSASSASYTAGSLLSDPVESQQIDSVNPGSASTTERQAPISSQNIRGTTQQVTSGGNAQAAQMTPAQIAELQKMEAAGISREDLDFRQKQMALSNSLESAAAGQGPSVASIQLQKANEDAIKSQASLAASARGGNIALAQRQAAQNVASLQQENAGKSAELKIQEQLAARGQLGDVLAQSRGQDIGVNTSQAGLAQEAAGVNAEAQNTRSIAQAGMEQQSSLTNATNTTTTNLANSEQSLTRDMFNSEQDFKAAQSDQAAQLEADKQTALNNINTDQFNAKAKDEMARFTADANLRKDIANQAAQLQAQGMTLDAAAKFMGIESSSLGAVLEAETGALKIEQDRKTAMKSGVTGMIGAGAAVVGAIVACFPAGEQVLMSDESTKSIEDLVTGDELWGSVVLETRRYVSKEALYRFGGATATGSHAVWTGSTWASFSDVGEHVGDAQPRDVFTVVTSSGVMVVGDALVGDDEHDADDLNKTKAA